MKRFFFVFVPALLVCGEASASSGDAFHRTTLLVLAVFAAAKLMGILCEKIGVPSLVGEILGGVVLGNLALFGIHYDFAEAVLHSPFFGYAAELGVVFLLFVVGLESNLADLVKVGFDSFITATIGVILPSALGFMAMRLLGLGGGLEALLVGATFAATSVGITAKVFTEFKKLKTPSAQIVLGAAVVDDVMGLVILAAVAGIATTGRFSASEITLILAKVGVFFGAALFLGHYVLPRVFKIYPRIEQPGILTVLVVMFALAFADLAYLAGLAPIVGAFTAGLLLDEVKLRYSGGVTTHRVEELVKPIMDFLLPIFFVSIGVQVKLDTLWHGTNFLLILLFLILAVLGKTVCGMACKGQGVDRLGIGLGMIPRGEVGLIFAAFGLQQRIVSPEIYSILIFVVLLTTILGPLLLKFRIRRF
jgi:Kef-type K+ transport system membrane component KefB